MGFESHGKDISIGNGRRFVTQFGQLCHLLGENGYRSKASMFAFVSQVSGPEKQPILISEIFEDLFKKKTKIVISVHVYNRGWNKTPVVQHADWD